MNMPWSQSAAKAELSESKVKSWQLTLITVVSIVTAAVLDRLGSGADITGPILLIAAGCAASLQTRRVGPSPEVPSPPPPVGPPVSVVHPDLLPGFQQTPPPLPPSNGDPALAAALSAIPPLNPEDYG